MFSDPPEPTDCPHRSPDSIGVANCNCRGMPLVFWCSHPSVNTYVMLSRVRLGSQTIRLDDGNSVDIGTTVPKDCLSCEFRPHANEDLPPLASQLLSFGSAVLRFVTAGMPKVDEPTYDQRLKACLACPRLSQEGRCAHCGCWVSEKALWQTETCPEDRWKPPPKPISRREARWKASAAQTIQQICASCPMLNNGCFGPAGAECPRKLWPVFAAPKLRHKKRGCRGCGHV